MNCGNCIYSEINIQDYYPCISYIFICNKNKKLINDIDNDICNMFIEKNIKKTKISNLKNFIRDELYEEEIEVFNKIYMLIYPITVPTEENVKEIINIIQTGNFNNLKLNIEQLYNEYYIDNKLSEKNKLFLLKENKFIIQAIKNKKIYEKDCNIDNHRNQLSFIFEKV